MKLLAQERKVKMILDAPSRGHDLKLEYIKKFSDWLGCPLTGA